MRFLLIDRIVSWKSESSATAIKNITLSEDFFEDHFPHKPIMPGMLILEGMAQLGGLLLEDAARQTAGRPLKALMSIVEKAKFRHPAYPGDQLRYEVQVLGINEMGGRINGHAFCGEELIAESLLTFTFHPFENESLEKRQKETVDLWMKGIEA